MHHFSEGGLLEVRSALEGRNGGDGKLALTALPGDMFNMNAFSLEEPH